MGVTLALEWLIVGLVIIGVWSLIEVCVIAKNAQGNQMA